MSDPITLTEWQEEVVQAIVAGIPLRLVVGHGRRSGWTVLMQEAERRVRAQVGLGDGTIWDGAKGLSDDE